MGLDLNELLGDWAAPTDEPAARLVTLEGGRQALQLRIELGLLQMELDGRPDGSRCHGHPTVQEYCQREQHLGRPIPDELWRELDRELHQFNYRRMALTYLVEQSTSEKPAAAELELLTRLLADIETCLSILHMGCEAAAFQGISGLLPTLMHDRARFRARWFLGHDMPHEAIAEADAGVAALEDLVAELDASGQMRAADPTIESLRRASRRMRKRFGIQRTLSEQLEDAIAHDDFETAARIHSELEQHRSIARGVPGSE